MKLKSQALFFMLFSFCYSFSQQNEIKETLFNKIQNFVNDGLRDSIIKYNTQLLKLVQSNKTSEFYSYALLNDAIYNTDSKSDSELKINEVLSIFKKRNQQKYILLAYQNLAEINRAIPNVDKAGLYSDSVINLLKRNKTIKNISEVDRKEYLLLAYHSISGNLYFNGEYEKALKNEIIAKKYADSIKNKNFDKIDIGLGMINIALGKHEKARKTFKNLISNSENISLKTFCYMSLGESFYEKKEYDSSIIYYKKAKQLSVETKDYYKLASTLINIGRNETAIENLKTAEFNLVEALNIIKEHNFNNIKESTLIGLSDVYIKLGKNSDAIKMLSAVQDSAKRFKRVPIIRDSYKLLSEAYLNKRDYKKAYEYRQLFIKLSDSIKSADIIKNSEELQLKYETEKKEKENLELKQEAFQKDLTIVKKNNYILFGTLLFSGLLAVLIFIQLKKTKKKNKALQASMEQREKAEKELETVRDNISKDFHDDLGNRLARITTLSDLILATSDKRDKQNVLHAVEKIKEDSDVLYNGTRDFMFSLKAKSDYAEELFTYLSDFGEDYFQSFNIDFFVSKKMDRNVKLPYYWNRQIIMIFKEAMTNIAKHSKSKKVELLIELSGRDLNMSLNDDGIGFDIQTLKRKNGILNMTLRAKKINGSLCFVSDEGGTVVNFKAQLPS